MSFVSWVKFFVITIILSFLLSGCSGKRREKISIPSEIQSQMVQPAAYTVSQTELMNRAQKAFELTEYEAASVLLEEVLKKDPYHPQARKLLSLILYNQGKDLMTKQHYSTAYQVLKKAYTIDSKNFKVAELLGEIHLRLSEEYIREKSPVNAVLELEKVLTYLPYHQEAISRLVEFYDEYGFIDEAELFISKLIDQGRVPGKLVEKIGDLFSQKGQIEKAQFYWKIAQGYLPDDMELASKIGSLSQNTQADYYVMASGMIKKKKWLEAYRLYGESLQFRPDLAWQIHYFRGVCMKELGRYKDAIEEWKKSLEKKAENPYPALKLAGVYLELNLPDKAMEYYHRIRGSENLEVSLQLVDILSENNRDKEALQEMLELKSKHPGNTEVLEKLGLSYAKLGHYSQATVCFEQLIANNSYVPKNYYNLAVIYSKEGNLNSAVKMFEKAVSLDPDSDLYHYSLGLAHRNLGNYELARKSWRQVEKIKPNGQYARIVKPLLQDQDAEVSFVSGEIEKTQETQKDLADPDAVYEYAKLCYESGREGTAIRFFEKLLVSQKYEKEATLFLTRLYSRNEKPIESILFGVKALEYKVENYTIYRAIADSYFNLRYYDKSSEYYEQAILKTNDVSLQQECRYFIGMGLLYNRKYEESYAVLDKLINSTSDKIISKKAEDGMKMASARIKNENLQGFGLDKISEFTQIIYRKAEKMKLYNFSLKGVEEYLLMKGESLDVLYEKANLLYQLNNYSGALEVYRYILGKMPGSYISHRRIGEIFFEQGSYLESLKEFEIAYQLDESDEVLFKMMDISLKIPFVKKAKEYYKIASKKVKNLQLLKKYENKIESLDK